MLVKNKVHARVENILFNLGEIAGETDHNAGKESAADWQLKANEEPQRKS